MIAEYITPGGSCWLWVVDLLRTWCMRSDYFLLLF